MPIPVRQQTVDVVKQLTNVEFVRDLDTNELAVEFSFQEGYLDSNGSFISLSNDINNLNSEQASYVLGLRPSDGGLSDPSLADMLVTIFEAIETGALTLPQPPEPEPEPE